MRAKVITLKRARRLRSGMTESEVRLWARLRRRDGEAIFRRQHAIGPYILDFYCPAARLAVEVDGGVHSESGQIAHDERRDAWLRQQRIVVHRLQASAVWRDPDAATFEVRALVAALIKGRDTRDLEALP